MVNNIMCDVSDDYWIFLSLNPRYSQIILTAVLVHMWKLASRWQEGLIVSSVTGECDTGGTYNYTELVQEAHSGLAWMGMFAQVYYN